MSQLEVPPAELDVMKCLWKMDQATARAIREALSNQRPMSHSSVCTLLNRLIDKGLVKREKGESGKAFIFSANVAPTKTRLGAVSALVDRVFDGSGVDLVASLLESKPPTPQELEQLQGLLDELKQRNKHTRNTKKGSK